MEWVHGLPVQPTRLIGRDTEIAAVRARLCSGEVRLLTLTGAPGVGKTRLAVAAAAACGSHFADGVRFVPLEAVRDALGLLQAIAAAFSIREGSTQPLAALVESAVAAKRLLLVLDNFEQLLPAAVELGRLVSACSGLTVLVTSRAPLRLRWEHEQPVAPLALPESGEETAADLVRRSPAVSLFEERARAVMPRFTVNSDNAGVVTAICTRLDGLPLALELAAARLRMLTLAAILSRLQSEVGQSSMGVLTGGARDLPERQRTLRTAIRWSYDLLIPEGQALFRRLSVFAGGASWEALEAVAGDATAGLEHELENLIEQNLVLYAQAMDGEPRVEMLSVVREFAMERLADAGEAEGVGERHCTFFAALAEALAPRLTGAGQDQWLQRFESEHHNLRAALRWAAGQQRSDLGLRLCASLWRFWWTRGYLSEGRRWLHRFITPAFPAGGAAEGGLGAPPATVAQALLGAGALAQSQGDFDDASTWKECGLALCREIDDRPGTADALNSLGSLALRRGDPAAAHVLFEECLEIRRTLGDVRGTAVALNNLGLVVKQQGNPAIAAGLYEESLAQARTVDDAFSMANALHNLAAIRRLQGDYKLARMLFEESLALRRRLGDRSGMAASLHELGETALAQNDADSAYGHYSNSLSLCGELADKAGTVFNLEGLAAAAAQRGRPERACRLLGAADVVRESLGMRRQRTERAAYDRAYTVATAALGEATARLEWERGRLLTGERAVAEALALDSEMAGGPGLTAEAAPPTDAVPDVGAGTSPPVREIAGLSIREREVLRLVAAGRTNREIADELVLSVRTIESHVFNACAKIGARGRAEAVAYVVRHGIA